MKNVTVSLDEETARWARVEAARQDVSVSSFVRMMLQRAMATHESYERSMDRFLGRGARPLKARGRYPTRDQLHDRARLR